MHLFSVHGKLLVYYVEEGDFLFHGNALHLQSGQGRNNHHQLDSYGSLVETWWDQDLLLKKWNNCDCYAGCGWTGWGTFAGPAAR